MSWTPCNTLSEIIEAENRAEPIVVTVYDDAGTANEVPMRVGGRYRIATEHINVLCTVAKINYGAQAPLCLIYLNDFGDSLFGWFNPDDILLVYPL